MLSLKRRKESTCHTWLWLLLNTVANTYFLFVFHLDHFVEMCLLIMCQKRGHYVWRQHQFWRTIQRHCTRNWFGWRDLLHWILSVEQISLVFVCQMLAEKLEIYACMWFVIDDSIWASREILQSSLVTFENLQQICWSRSGRWIRLHIKWVRAS